MTLRRSDSLPTRLRVVPVSTGPIVPNTPDTNPDHNLTPTREEVSATWKSLNSDVNSIKNGFPSNEAGETNGKGTQNFAPAFMCNNRNVRRKITYDNRTVAIDEADQCSSVPLDPRQGTDTELGQSKVRRRNLLQRLFSWKTAECDCRERYTPKYQTRRLRPEDLLCTCGASARRIKLPHRSGRYTERGRSKSVGYEAAREVAQFRRCASAGATVGTETAAALRARAALTLARRYYPEGGWGWTITVVGTLVQVLSHGLQLGGGAGPIACTAAVKFRVPPLYTH
ncbi:Monocarboxylate transporter, partial [Operophtera brumata]